MNWLSRLLLGPRDWVQTFSGVVYYPTKPEVAKIRIIDIAHALANLCRYTGHCRIFYSVAEHSVHVSYCVPPEMALAGLLHDATEAYVNDLNRPLKHSWLLWGYRVVERRNWLAIAEKFGLPATLPPEIHEADLAVLFAEQAELMLPLPQYQGWQGEAADVAIIGHAPEQAEKLFMDRFYELTRGFPMPELKFPPRRINPPSIIRTGCMA